MTLRTAAPTIRAIRLAAARELGTRLQSRALQAATTIMLLAVVATIVLPAMLRPDTQAIRRIGLSGTAPEGLPAALTVQAAATGSRLELQTYPELAGGEDAVRTSRIDVLLVDGTPAGLACPRRCRVAHAHRWGRPGRPSPPARGRARAYGPAAGRAARPGADALTTRIASFIPVTAPLVMPIRLARGQIAPWETTVAAADHRGHLCADPPGGGRVYAGALLHTGGKMRLRDAWRVGAADIPDRPLTAPPAQMVPGPDIDLDSRQHRPESEQDRNAARTTH